MRAFALLAGAVAFKTVWETTNPNETISLPISAPFTGSINWGDNTTENVTNITGLVNHTYSGASVHTIELTGGTTEWRFSSLGVHAFKIVRIELWDGFLVGSNSDFKGCAKLSLAATDQPVFLPGASLAGFFEGCLQLNSVLSWDLAGVRSLQRFLNGAAAFDSPLHLSNTGDVFDLGEMFRGATHFNQPLSLDTSSVTLMRNMFNGASAFNQFLNFTSTGSVTSFDYMFSATSAFNQNLDHFNTSSAISMEGMFYRAESFNQSLNWDTGQVGNMHDMFNGALKFNSALNFTSTAKVTSMRGMFFGTNFNQPLCFDTRSVDDVRDMFPVSFQQNLAAWNVSAVTQLLPVCRYCGLPNFDLGTNCNLTATSYGWVVCNCPPGHLCDSPPAFRTQWVVDSDSIALPIFGKFSISVDWGDGTPLRAYVSGPVTHKYTKVGNVTIVITGKVQNWSFNGSAMATKLLNIVSWGDFEVGSGSAGGFQGCSNLTVAAADQPTFAEGATLANFFRDCVSFNSPLSWDLTGVVSLRGFLQNALTFNQPLNFSGTSDVTDLSFMFYNARSFNESIFFDDLTSVMSMSNMFTRAISFVQNLAAWHVPSVTNCTEFCFGCGLPMFMQCVPCASIVMTPVGWPVCHCPLNQRCEGSSINKVRYSLGSGIVHPLAQFLSRLNGSLEITRSPANPQVYSEIVGYAFYDSNNEEVSISNLTRPLPFSLLFTPGISVADASENPILCLGESAAPVLPLCHWFNSTSQHWDSTGCQTSWASDQIECACNRLGEFAAVIPANGQRVSSSPDYGALIVVVVVGVLLTVVLGFLIRRDGVHSQPPGSGTSTESSSLKTLCQRMYFKLRSYHTWGALLSSEPGAIFSSVDRAVVTGLMIFTLLCISASFQNLDLARPLLVFFAIVVGSLSALLGGYLLTHTGKPGAGHDSASRCFAYRFPGWCRWMWYIMIVVAIAGMIYSIFESLMLHPDAACRDFTARWMVEVVISYAIIVFLLEPFLALVLPKPTEVANHQAKILQEIQTDQNESKTVNTDVASPDTTDPSVKSNVQMDAKLDVKPAAKVDSNSEAIGAKYAQAALPTFSFSDIEITGALGQGAFGKVDQCIWRGADCAIKRLLNPIAEAEFWHEVAINRHLSPHKHQCVVSFLGVTENPPGMLLELYPLRSVEDFIIREGNLGGPGDLCNLLTVMISASAGVLHLHMNGVVHRDIAARNFLIRHDLNAAICDFGLALLLNGHEGQRTVEERKKDMLPINTSAPETVFHGHYSAKSDVYMFGIFLWELLARQVPHASDPALRARDLPAFAHRVRGGLRPTLPPEWPEPLCRLIQACWALDPVLRPTMTMVNRALRDFRKMAETDKITLPALPALQQSSFSHELNYYEATSTYSETTYDKSLYETYGLVGESQPSSEAKQVPGIGGGSVSSSEQVGPAFYYENALSASASGHGSSVPQASVIYAPYGPP